MRPLLLRWEPRWTASPTCCRTSSRSCWRSRSTRTTRRPATTARATPIRKAEKRTSIIIQTSSLPKCFDFLKYTFVFFSEIRQKIISPVFVGLFSGFALWASSCWIWWCYINVPKGHIENLPSNWQGCFIQRDLTLNNLLYPFWCWVFDIDAQCKNKHWKPNV